MGGKHNDCIVEGVGPAGCLLANGLREDRSTRVSPLEVDEDADTDRKG